MYHLDATTIRVAKNKKEVYVNPNWRKYFDEIGDEFDENYIIKTNGDEYKRVDEIKQLSLKLIVPKNK